MKQQLILILILVVIGILLTTVDCALNDSEATKEDKISKEELTEEEQETIKIVQKAANFYGEEYEKLRDEVVKKGGKAKEVLASLLKDESWDIRMTAYFITGWINHEKTYKEFLMEKGVLRRDLRYVFPGWNNYGPELISLLLERVAKDNLHSYIFLGYHSVKGSDEEVFEQCRREAITIKLQNLLPLVDKEIVADLNILVPNINIRNFLLNTLECSSVFPVGGKRLLLSVNPDPTTFEQRIKVILEGAALKELQEAIREEKDECNKVTLFLALHLKGDEEALTSLLKIIPDLKLSEAQIKALKILGETADKSLIPNLEELSSKTDDEELKKAVPEVIEKITIRSQTQEKRGN